MVRPILSLRSNLTDACRHDIPYVAIPNAPCVLPCANLLHLCVRALPHWRMPRHYYYGRCCCALARSFRDKLQGVRCPLSRPSSYFPFSCSNIIILTTHRMLHPRPLHLVPLAIVPLGFAGLQLGLERPGRLHRSRDCRPARPDDGQRLARPCRARFGLLT